MATVNEKMTALANEIRQLSGTTTSKSIDAMTSDVNAANTEITEQMDLISQITNALEGKAVSSSTPSSGVSIDTGTFVFDEDKASNFVQSHNLGKTPSFVIIYTEETPAHYTDYNGYIHHQIMLCDTYIDPSKTIYAHIYTDYGTSETLKNIMLHANGSVTANTTLFVAPASDSYKFKAGVTYRYVCGTLPGI